MLPASMRFTVVVPTYNRWSLLPATLESIRRQDWPDLQVIVVDDHSVEHAPPHILDRVDLNITLIRHSENRGPGEARNSGLHAAMHPWIVMLDDDDQFAPDALSTIANRICTMEDSGQYPVFQFGHSTAVLDNPFDLVRTEHYFRGSIRGDFVPVLHKNSFLDHGYGYPSLRVGGEHLLWWTVAQRSAIPTWREPIAFTGTAYRSRLTSWKNQWRHAAEYAEMHEISLAQFGGVMEAVAPAFFERKTAAAATYWTLHGDRHRAAPHIRALFARNWLMSTAIWASGLLPRPLLKVTFGAYRTLEAM